MTIYRYESISSGKTDKVNRLLTLGWKPVREFGTGDNMTVVLEKEDTTQPVTRDEITPGVSVSFLHDVPVLFGLSEKECRRVLAVSEVHTFEQGQTVFSEGDDDRALWIVLTGTVEVDLPPLPGENTEITQIGPGDVLGESSFFSELPHAASAKAVTDVRLLRLSRDRYDELMQAGCLGAWLIALNAATVLAIRLHETDGWVRDLLEQEQNARIAASWRRFRESTGRTFTAHGFFRT